MEKTLLGSYSFERQDIKDIQDYLIAFLKNSSYQYSSYARSFIPNNSFFLKEESNRNLFFKGIGNNGESYDFLAICITNPELIDFDNFKNSLFEANNLGFYTIPIFRKRKKREGHSDFFCPLRKNDEENSKITLVRGEKFKIKIMRKLTSLESQIFRNMGCVQYFDPEFNKFERYEFERVKLDNGLLSEVVVLPKEGRIISVDTNIIIEPYETSRGVKFGYLANNSNYLIRRKPEQLGILFN